MQRKKKNQETKINGAKFKIGIVISDFNSDITRRLLSGAIETLEKNNVKKKNVVVVHVPGGFEIPLACKRLAKTRHFDALIALGCVIKGETDHNHYISSAVTAGIMTVMLARQIPIGFGILTPNNLSQAVIRSNRSNNKGSEAAMAALRMISR